ncbi:hypothetical protein QJS04_geneDACA020286 [Acorus gramineus]|uniref:Uncharacterized protein n=1 Tax=Acorus gramineus TaxID=55184 RepID=A0AAV9AD46_ACOGR|nr:hypothetical protein QJS04_geneDACA020286 [Acorus gramineus]
MDPEGFVEKKLEKMNESLKLAPPNVTWTKASNHAACRKLQRTAFMSLNLVSSLIGLHGYHVAAVEKLEIAVVTLSETGHQAAEIVVLAEQQARNQAQSIPIPLANQSQARQQILPQTLQDPIASANLQGSTSMPPVLPSMTGLNSAHCLQYWSNFWFAEYFWNISEYSE